MRIASVNILRSLTSKGVKDPSAKLQVVKVLDVLRTIEPLMSTDDETFKAALASWLAAYGVTLIEMFENVS